MRTLVKGLGPPKKAFVVVLRFGKSEVMRTIFVFVAALMAGIVLGVSDKRPVLVKQPRVYIDAGSFVEGSDEEKKDSWTGYFRVACPHMAILRRGEAADYQVDATWYQFENGRKGWNVEVTRRDTAETYVGTGLQPGCCQGAQGSV